jgi:hypothetical protein
VVDEEAQIDHVALLRRESFKTSSHLRLAFDLFERFRRTGPIVRHARHRIVALIARRGVDEESRP